MVVVAVVGGGFRWFKWEMGIGLVQVGGLYGGKGKRYKRWGGPESFCSLRKQLCTTRNKNKPEKKNI